MKQFTVNFTINSMPAFTDILYSEKSGKVWAKVLGDPHHILEPYTWKSIEELKASLIAGFEYYPGMNFVNMTAAVDTTEPFSVMSPEGNVYLEMAI